MTSRLIAVTGKGGVGKTTVAALLVSALVRRGRKPVLAVDADPNTCLDAALGVRADQTVGGIREHTREIAGKGLAAGVAKRELLEMKVTECLVESEDFDLIAMGRPEGPGCYCYINNVLRDVLDRLSANYDYVVIDNEAGMEHLSRRTTRDVDVLFIMSDMTVLGILTASRIKKLSEDLNLVVGKTYLVLNEVKSAVPKSITGQIERERLNLIGTIPNDEIVEQYALEGKSLLQLPRDSAALKAVSAIAAHSISP